MEFYREKHIEYIKALDTVGVLMIGLNNSFSFVNHV